jgi:hypothetical protein
MARTELPMEERPSNITESCEISIKHSHITQRGPKTTRLPKKFTKIEEGERHLDKAKPPEWMDAEIRMKEFNISNDDRPKMVRVGDYWSDKQTTDIVSLLKEYQDVFARDYKDLKGLVEEMGEMKIELIPGEKPIKK